MRDLDLHIVLEIDDDDPADDGAIAANVSDWLKRVGFIVVDAEALPEGVKVVMP